MKVFGVYSEANKELKDEWFLKTLADDFDLHLECIGSNGGHDVSFSSNYWYYALRKRHEYICQAISDNQGEIILSMDMDIQFFGPCLPIINETITGKDIVFQSEHWLPTGEVNAGFAAIRCNEKTLNFYNRAAQTEFEKMLHGDQSAINMLLQEKSNNLEWGVFPAQVWARSHGCAPPDDIILHHANCTSNTAQKIRQLNLIRQMVSAKSWSLGWMYRKVYNFKNTKIK